jgi:PAS domain S-box-containing protein
MNQGGIQFTPLLLLYLVSAVVTLGMAVYAVRRRETGGTATETRLAFVGIVLSVSVWTVARSLELLFVGEALSRFWLTVVYIGYGGATMSALFFGLAFTGRRQLLTRRTVGLLLAVPVLAVGVAATNQLHELFWRTIEFEERTGWWGSIVVHRRQFQPLFFAYLVYTVSAALTGIYYLLRAAFGSATVYRRQRVALVAGSGAALTTGVLFALGRQPLVPDWLDLSPVGFAVMGVCFGYAAFQHRLLDLVPVARDNVIEGMRDGYVVLDTDDRVVDLNRAARDVFDVTEAVLGTPVAEALPACADVVENHEHDTRQERDIELDDDGETRFLTVAVSSLHEGERLVGRLLLLQDITERRQVQRRYRALIENSSDMILVIDRDRNISYASPSVETITGIDPETVVGENAFTFVHPEDRPEFEQLFERLLDDPGEKVRYEYRIQNSDGDQLYMEASVWNLLDNPFVEGLVVNAREITGRRQRERELERANEQLEEFASVISHDLRNPLNVAQGHLQLARDSPEERHLGKVEDALDRMEAIVDDVLTLAREGKSIGETEPVDLASNARRAWGHVETDSATLVVADDATIEADGDRLLQLFENLFRNAVEHAVPGETFTRSSAATATDTGNIDEPVPGESDGAGHTELTVTVGIDDSLYVEDSGVGIPEDERDEVIEAGYTTSRDGTGFGLSIVTQIAEAHGWTVEVTESTDGGARFEFDGVERVE